MSTDNSAQDEAVWGASPADVPRWGLRETLTAVGIAAVIAGLGGAAVYAATGHQSSPFGGPPGQHQMGPGGPPDPLRPGASGPVDGL